MAAGSARPREIAAAGAAPEETGREMRTADAVVIGAGVIGASVAYHLAKRGLTRIVVLDKHVLASGGTGRSAAIVRQHYSSEELVRMMRRSLAVFRRFGDEVGGDAGYVECGWVFLAPEEVSAGVSKNLEMQQRLGVNTREISRDDLRAIEPRIEAGDAARIVYEPESGYADPHATTCGYLQQLRQMGGALVPMTAVHDIVVTASKVTHVRTTGGDIATGIVVNAAGPWAAQIAAYVRLDVPIRVTREQELVLETAAVGGPPRVVFSDMVNAIYGRPEGRSRLLLGRGFPKEYEEADPDRFDQQADHEFVRDAIGRMQRRFPAFGDALVVNTYAGLYDVTPDWHPILGAVDGTGGFYMCAGFSGHGFKLAPAVGELVASEIAGGAAERDLARFRLSRFSAGELFQAAYGGNRA